MRQKKEKEIEKMANLQHLFLRFYCYSIQEYSDGFTLAEVLLVAVIIAIAAMIAVPMINSADGVQIRSAANMIAADLEYAKSMAISRQKNYSVVFNAGGNCYEVHDPNGIIEHPVKKGFNYKVDFSSNSRIDNVIIDNVDFDPGSSNTITFDYLGSPYSGNGISNSLNGGIVTIRARNFTETISIEPVTGFILITY